MLFFFKYVKLKEFLFFWYLNIEVKFMKYFDYIVYFFKYYFNNKVIYLGYLVFLVKLLIFRVIYIF